MIPLRYHLADGLHDALELLEGPNDPAVDELELGKDGRAELLERAVEAIDVLDGLRRLWVLRLEVVLCANGVIDGCEVLGVAGAAREEG